MSLKKYLITAGAVTAITVFCMLFVPPVATTFEGLVLLFLGTFATG